MSITSLGPTSLSVSGTQKMDAIDISMLKKSLDSVEMSGDMITKMMEQSVNPNIGANIDVRL
ncbi:MAG: YjfB family protein [Clostridium sp.]|nr:YjfB family protein [Clostridium sp.]MCM1173387.1 YjfB family protein [Clostridium sp.]MCM1209856.1 YjfB family protein [Ruminococcus sp.]MCM1287428.1 YjfB family protein [Clostridium sp.]